MSTLTAIEAAVLDMLLAGESPTLRILRSQRDHMVVTSRESSGVGLFTTSGHPARTLRLQDPARARFGDVLANISGLQHEAGFLLFIDDGLITMLESDSTANEPWPADPGTFVLRYRPPERDLGPLGMSPTL